MYWIGYKMIQGGMECIQSGLGRQVGFLGLCVNIGLYLHPPSMPLQPMRVENIPIMFYNNKIDVIECI
jgi:hypothetical protein